MASTDNYSPGSTRCRGKARFGGCSMKSSGNGGQDTKLESIPLNYQLLSQKHQFASKVSASHLEQQAPRSRPLAEHALCVAPGACAICTEPRRVGDDGAGQSMFAEQSVKPFFAGARSIEN